MNTHRSHARRAIAAAVTLSAMLACNLQSTQLATSTATLEANATPVASASAQATLAASATLPGTATTSPTQGPPPVVKVNAVGGRLNVRRGPGPEYDTVGSFLDGQSSVATARNSDSTWVLINIPNGSKSLGWLTLATKYTVVTGVVTALPLAEVGAATPAYIRNCTSREMLVNPIGAILLARANAPENRLQFFPGEYSIIEVETEISIGDVTVFEGRTIDIKQDSSGTNFAC